MKKSDCSTAVNAGNAEDVFEAFGCLIIPALTASAVLEFREKLKLSQQEFASMYELPLSTLVAWEDGSIKPDLSIAKLYDPKNAFDPKRSKVIDSVHAFEDTRLAA